jgi:hypothetical protein
MELVSIGWSHYFITFNNDFLWKSWVYFIRKKSDALEVFKIFIALVERKSRKEVKSLRRDNGGEYCSKEFKRFCKYQGNSRLKTTPHTLEKKCCR